MDWFDTNKTVLINPREKDGSEMSVFDHSGNLSELEQSGLFWNYETDSSEYLVWKDNYDTLKEASDPDNYDSWWIERVKDKSTLDNQNHDCSIIMRTFDKTELAQVKDMFHTLYPTRVNEAYSLLMQTICGEIWQTFYPEDSEWYSLYESMPTTSGTFGTYYYDDRQVEMYCNDTCTRVTIQVSKEGYESPDEPRILTDEEICFHTEQAKSRYCLELWGLK